tara:strand:+ start:350 stop:538 length:189 start_codon:yes stop_codon:yes gene_type:complete
MGCGCGKSSRGSRPARSKKKSKRNPAEDSTKPLRQNNGTDVVKKQIEKIKERIRRRREEENT